MKRSVKCRADDVGNSSKETLPGFVWVERLELEVKCAEHVVNRGVNALNYAIALGIPAGRGLGLYTV